MGKGASDGGSVDVDFSDCAFYASYTLAVQLHGNFVAQALTLHPPQRPAIAFYLGDRDKGWVTIIATLSVSNISELRREPAILKAEADLIFYDYSSKPIPTKLHWQHFLKIDYSRVSLGSLPHLTDATDAAPFVVPNTSTVSRAVWFVPRSEPCEGNNCTKSYRRYGSFLKQ